MSFLDAKSYDTLFGLPELYEDALPRFSLSCEDIAFARTHRRSHNRLGFAIQLALVRDLGRTLRVCRRDSPGGCYHRCCGTTGY